MLDNVFTLEGLGVLHLLASLYQPVIFNSRPGLPRRQCDTPTGEVPQRGLGAQKLPDGFWNGLMFAVWQTDHSAKREHWLQEQCINEGMHEVSSKVWVSEGLLWSPAPLFWHCPWILVVYEVEPPVSVLNSSWEMHTPPAIGLLPAGDVWLAAILRLVVHVTT